MPGRTRSRTPWRPGTWPDFLCCVSDLRFHGEFLLIDLANLVVHEGGHLLFGWFGPVLGLGRDHSAMAGAAILAAYFFTQRQTTAFALCLFFFFENWLYTATYMADARAMALPLVTAGDSDYVDTLSEARSSPASGCCSTARGLWPWYGDWVGGAGC